MSVNASAIAFHGLHPSSIMLGTSYEMFTTAYGCEGLAKLIDGGIEVLAVVSEQEGKGNFRRLVDDLKKQYAKIVVLEIWSDIVLHALQRYGFQPHTQTGPDGEVNHGLIWHR